MKERIRISSESLCVVCLWVLSLNSCSAFVYEYKHLNKQQLQQQQQSLLQLPTFRHVYVSSIVPASTCPRKHSSHQRTIPLAMMKLNDLNISRNLMNTNNRIAERIRKYKKRLNNSNDNKVISNVQKDNLLNQLSKSSLVKQISSLQHKLIWKRFMAMTLGWVVGLGLYSFHSSNIASASAAAAASSMTMTGSAASAAAAAVAASSYSTTTTTTALAAVTTTLAAATAGAVVLALLSTATNTILLSHTTTSSIALSIVYTTNLILRSSTVSFASMGMVLQNLASLYMHSLHTNPLITKALTAGVIGITGDYMAQSLEHTLHKRKRSSTNQKTNNGNQKHVQKHSNNIDSHSNAHVHSTINNRVNVHSSGDNHHSVVSSTTKSDILKPVLKQSLSQVLYNQLTLDGNYHPRRGLSILADGVLVSGPLMHIGYNIFEKIIPVTSLANGSCSNVAAIVHVIADSIILDSIFIASTFIITGMFQGYRFRKQIIPQFRLDYIPTLKVSWITSLLLLPIEFICFRYLPLSFRVLAVNLIDVVWDGAISYMAHRNRGSRKELDYQTNEIDEVLVNHSVSDGSIINDIVHLNTNHHQQHHIHTTKKEEEDEIHFSDQEYQNQLPLPVCNDGSYELVHVYNV